MHYNISTVGLCAAKVAVRNTVRLLSYTKGGKHLGVVDVYTKIPYDLSGSISKNRFRQELCWGISKMFDLFDKEDFCVVFDYKCDIEIHFNDSIEFYQIKTHKIQSPYKFSNLKRHKDGPSIIAKLPVVFDSPNNAETDETKKRQIYSYICERITENQLIVSGLGFSGDEILDSFDSIITLTNNKYELLCQKDYDANVSLLRELNNK